MRIWRNAGRYQPSRGSGPGWIVAIARNAAIDRLRQRRAPTRDLADMPELADPGPTPEASAVAAQDRRRIERLPRRACPTTGRRRCAAPIWRARPTTSWRGASRCRSTPCGPGCGGRSCRCGSVWKHERPVSRRRPAGDPDALAAEFVLRLLPPDEEAACAARVAPDPAFAAAVARWQAAFSALDREFAPMAPPPRLLAAVEERLFGRASWPPPGSGRARLLARRRRGGDRGRGGVGGTPAAAERPPPPQLVATVTPAAPARQACSWWHCSTGPRGCSASPASPVRRRAGRSLELWLLPRVRRPGPARRRARRRSVCRSGAAGLRRRVASGTAILVSDEVAGGSPTGQPQGAVLAQGAIGEL